MPKGMSHAACFAKYGTKKVNPRQSWSARNEATRTVAATLWNDRFEEGIDLYRSQTHLDEKGWESRFGHRELVRNLAWARDNCGGEVRVIMATPKDPKASPRSIDDCYPRPDVRMRIDHLDEPTGEFVLRRIVS